MSRTVDHPTGGLQLKETDDMFGGPEDDGLGFDPFHETQKALAEMLESESNDWPGPSPVNQLHQPVRNDAALNIYDAAEMIFSSPNLIIVTTCRFSRDLCLPLATVTPPVKFTSRPSGVHSSSSSRARIRRSRQPPQLQRHLPVSVDLPPTEQLLPVAGLNSHRRAST